MKNLLALALLGLLSLPLAATAQQAMSPQEKGLSAPVIALTGVLAKNADTLELDDSQRAALKDWIGEMPARRQALEADAVALRNELRALIIEGGDSAERQALAEQIGAREAELVMMRSMCVDHWRAVLNEDQFASLLALAGVEN